MASFRKKKLEELIKRVVADAILKEVKDPRIGFVSVYSVELDKDYSLAQVNISVLGDEKQKKKSLAGLNAAKGFIRSFVGKHVKLRFVPDIVFKLDTTVEDGVGLVNLIDGLGVSNNDEVAFENDKDD